MREDGVYIILEGLKEAPAELQYPESQSSKEEESEAESDQCNPSNSCDTGDPFINMIEEPT